MAFGADLPRRFTSNRAVSGLVNAALLVRSQAQRRDLKVVCAYVEQTLRYLRLDAEELAAKIVIAQ